MKLSTRPAALKLTLAATGVLALLATSACGGSTTNTAGTATAGGTANDAAANTSSSFTLPAKDATLAAMLPQSLQSKGELNVATATYAPAVVLPPSGGEPTGWDIQITQATAALLGLKVNFTVIPFDGVIPGLQAGRYDAAMGEINVTEERAKVVTFVVNHVSQDEILLKKDAEQNEFASATDLCGLTLGAQVGSSEAATAQEFAKECEAAGKELTVSTFADPATTNLALTQGRVDANLVSASQAVYTAEQSNGALKVAKLGFGPEIQTGLALANNADTAQTAKAFEAATNKLIESGQLQEILDASNGGLGAVTKSEIVPAPAS